MRAPHFTPSGSLDRTFWEVWCTCREDRWVVLAPERPEYYCCARCGLDMLSRRLTR